MENPTDRVYKTKNCVDKDKVLGVKSLIVFKGVMRKRFFEFNPSGCL